MKNQASRQLYPEQFPGSWASAWGEDRYGLWSAFEVNNIEQVMRWIPPGVFLMGDELQDNKKQTVSVDGFWLADTPCTQVLYKAVTGENLSQFIGDSRPVDTISFEDARRFVDVLNNKVGALKCRLPAEKEWEYACRAGTNSPYVFGEAIEDSQARFGWIQGKRDDRWGTVDVKHYNPNNWGLYQMHGNVWEWCQDWYDGDRDLRVVRGGGWNDVAVYLRSGQRGGNTPGDRLNDLGFRLVRGQ